MNGEPVNTFHNLSVTPKNLILLLDVLVHSCTTWDVYLCLCPGINQCCILMETKPGKYGCAVSVLNAGSALYFCKH